MKQLISLITVMIISAPHALCSDWVEDEDVNLQTPPERPEVLREEISTRERYAMQSALVPILSAFEKIAVLTALLIPVTTLLLVVSALALPVHAQYMCIKTASAAHKNCQLLPAPISAVSQFDRADLKSGNDAGVDAKDIVAFNTKSYIYHAPNCSSALACTRNCISLTRGEAKNRGGRPCHRCGGGEL